MDIMHLIKLFLDRCMAVYRMIGSILSIYSVCKTRPNMSWWI